jgi:tartrate dehydrogenase/decarboxylase/D-malate dehydrogenase
MTGSNTTRTYRVAALPGDGIGNEVVPAAQRVLDALGASDGFRIEWTTFDWGCDYHRRHDRMMPEDGLDQLRPFDAVFLGSIGDPAVPDHVSLWGLLIPIRRGFRQCVNLRPIRLLAGVESPLSGRPAIDFVCVRENNEGEYSEAGGRVYAGTDDEVVIQESVFTRRGVERVMRYAFELAGSRRGKLASITKSNGIVHTMPFWDEVCADVGREYPEIEITTLHADAAAALFVQRPEMFDVVVASNLFGDLLTDLGAAVVGGIGMAPSANIDPSGTFPSMFEPIHGSAPDIAGQGVANPIGQLWSGVLMLDQLGEQRGAQRLMRAVESVLACGVVRTPDLGGTASTGAVIEEVLASILSA